MRPGLCFPATWDGIPEETHCQRRYFPLMDGSGKVTPVSEAGPAAQWSVRRKSWVSVLLGIHLLAVFAAPCASPPPASYLANWLAGRIEGRPGWLLPYTQALFLNHGYRFFAPNPGPSHLVRYEIELPGGGQIEGKFPDTEEHWPRLLYHRMFMISESVFTIEDPVTERPPPDAVNEEQMAEFEKQRATADALLKSIARRLLHEYDGHRVRLFLRRHEIPAPQQVLDGVPLDDEQFFRERLLGEFTQAEL